MSFAIFVCRQIKTLELNKDIVADIYPKTFDVAECCVITYEHITSACVMSPDTHGQIKALKKDVVVLQNTGRCDADRHFIYEPVRLKDIPYACTCEYPAPSTRNPPPPFADS